MSTRAHAQSDGQPWLGDRRFGEGIGIRTGNLEWHPGVAGEVGFDSNFLQAAGGVTPDDEVVLIAPQYRPVLPDGTTFGENGAFYEPIVSAYRFRVTPSLTLKTLGLQRTALDSPDAMPPVINFEASVSASYNEIIATDSDYELADNRFVSGHVGAALDILPQRPFGVGFTGDYYRDVQPINNPTAPPGYRRSTFRGGAALKGRPGAGLFSWSLGYIATYIMFEDDRYSTYSSVGHDVALRGQWLVLPRTALLFAGDYGVINYPDGGRTKPPGSPLSAQVGLRGLVTKHMAALIMAGWKRLSFDEDADFNGFIGNAELTWYPVPSSNLPDMAADVGLSSFGLGYRRDAQPSYLGNFVQMDSGYVKASYFFGGTLLTSLEGSLDHLRRPESLFSDLTRQTDAFSENRLTATGFIEYRTSATFAINTTLRYSAALTDQQVPLDNGPANPRLLYDDLGFDRIEAWLGVRWFL